MPEPIIRRATVADAAILSELGARTFTETFGHLYRPQDLSTFLDDAHSIERATSYLSDPRRAIWLIDAGDEAVGYAHAGPSDLPHPEVTANCGELKGLYLLSSHQGAGLGQALMETALAWLERDGPRPIWLGVWSENHGAQRFYRRFSFDMVGHYLFHVGEARDLELIMRRASTT